MANGRFEIVDILGAGAYAVVCTVTDRTTGETLALKVLRDAVRSDAGAVARFRDEGRILARLKHENIVCGLEVVEYATHPVLAIERVDGISLEHLLQAGERFLVPDALRIGALVAQALEFAWGAPDSDGEPMRVVHRDLKPNNVLLDRHGQVKVVDFGIATGSFAGRKARSLFVVHGTPGFDAPERTTERGDGPEVDVYGLGALLLALLTGKAPMISRKAGTRDLELAAYLDRIPQFPGVDGPGIRSAVERMLAATKEERPQMGDIVVELTAASGQAELQRLAARAVVPILDARGDPREHPCWSELAFLETDAPTLDRGRLSREEVECWVRDFVAAPGWENRVVELESVLGRGEPFAPASLVEVLARGRVPWYTPWVRSSRPGELEAALLVLCDRADRGVVACAGRLANHPDARVMAAARFLLAQAG